MEVKAPGKGLLKVTGILNVIVSLVLIVLALLALLDGKVLEAAGGDIGIMLGHSAVIFAVVQLVQGLFGLIMGILGVKNCDKPEKAGICLFLGVICVVLGLVNVVGNFMGQVDMTTMVSGFAGLVIPVLYTLGAVLNKSAAKGA